MNYKNWTINEWNFVDILHTQTKSSISLDKGIHKYEYE
jgi:hypothetical protein